MSVIGLWISGIMVGAGVTMMVFAYFLERLCG